MSEGNPYHILCSSKSSRRRIWKPWCELSTAGMRDRALPRLSYIHRKRLRFAAQNHGSEEIVEYEFPTDYRAVTSVARSISNIVDVPPTRNHRDR